MFEVNYLAVLVAGVAGMALGAFWYSPALLGKQWMEAVGLSEAKVKELQKKSGPKSYFVAFLFVLVLAYVLSYFLQMAGATTIKAAFQTVFWIWLGFMATIQIGVVLWEGKPTRLFFINTFYSLVQVLIMSAILVSW